MNTLDEETFAMDIIKAKLFERFRYQESYYPGEQGRWMNSVNSLAM